MGSLQFSGSIILILILEPKRVDILSNTFILINYYSTYLKNKNTVSSNQQNREYYSLHFSEMQKKLSGMKVELGKIE